MDSGESSQDILPTLDEISFWNSTRCATSSSGTHDLVETCIIN
jgi:hypothetical protein